MYLFENVSPEIMNVSWISLCVKCLNLTTGTCFLYLQSKIYKMSCVGSGLRGDMFVALNLEIGACARVTIHSVSVEAVPPPYFLFLALKSTMSCIFNRWKISKVQLHATRVILHSEHANFFVLKHNSNVAFNPAWLLNLKFFRSPGVIVWRTATWNDSQSYSLLSFYSLLPLSYPVLSVGEF